MNINKRFFMSAVFALLLVSPTAIADHNGGGGQGGGGHGGGGHNDGSELCESVNAVWNGTDFFRNPEQCDGFDYCIVGTLTGEPTGTLTFLGMSADEHNDPFGTNLPVNVSPCHELITTQDGDINVRCHNLFDQVNGVYTELLIVEGGTGKYEGATGTMVNSSKLLPTALVPLNWDEPSLLTGFICTSD